MAEEKQVTKKEKEKAIEGVDKDMNVHERLAFIQKNLKAPKGQVNTFGNYSYRSCEDILEAVKPLLGNCTLVITDEIVHFQSSHEPIVIKVTDSKGNVNEEIVGGDRFYIKATATLSDGKENVQGIAWAREAEGKKGMDEAQVTGASSSYARKYALNGLFTIDDTKDQDSMDNTTPNRAVSGAMRSGARSSQQDLMQKFGMNPNQKPPKCPTCGGLMNLVPRKDGTNIFWSCPNWRTKGCKSTYNIDDVDIDGNAGPKNQAQAEPPKDDIPF